MKKFMLVLLCSGIIFSCNTNDLGPYNFTFNFHPRDCNYAWIDLAQLFSLPGEGTTVTSLKNKSIKTKDFLFVITTCDIIDSFIFANRTKPQYDPINFPLSVLDHPYGDSSDSIDNSHFKPENQLEKQLANSFTNANQSQRPGGMDSPPPIDMEYRLTAVKNLTFSSNVTLFGQAAGSSLNNFIEIERIDPNCVISAQKQLVIGFDQNISQMSIQEWLNMHPMAAPSMLLRFKTAPAEAPVDAQLIFKMELAGGVVIRDTSSVVTLLP